MDILKLNYSLDLLPENYTGIIEYSDGSIFYFLNGKHHREDGPAIIFSHGTLEYCLNGLRHREDGPAIIWYDGIEEWCINNKDITKEVKKWIKQNKIPEDHEKWNNTYKILFKLTFG